MMSNISVKRRIEKTLEAFKSGDIDIRALKDSIELNGNALENMPYSAIKEIDDIEYKLTVSQFADEEGCHPNIEEVLTTIEAWLEKVPLESEW